MKPVEQALAAENRAVYLPAVSAGWAAKVGKGGLSGVSGLDYRDLDFLDPKTPLWHYPYCLYSAGPAAPKSSAPPKADMVTQRNRDETIVLGDSGGYQIQKGTIAFDTGTVGRMMRWMEAVSDWSMILDFPTGGIGAGALAPHVTRLRAEGHDLDALNTSNGMGIDYNACLLQTKLNNEQFLRERKPGATRFLNVIQGRNERESRYWYEQVRHYPFEGWSLAGAHQDNFAMIVSRLLDLRDDGLLAKSDWLHVLGRATLPVGVLLTAAQRAVRKYVNPRFQISFDVSSPFQLSINRSIQSGCTLTGEGWSSQSISLMDIPDTRADDLLIDILADSMERTGKSRVSVTSLSKRLRVSDLFTSGSRNMTSQAPDLLAHHNIEALVGAHEQAHDLMFGEAFIRDDLSVPLQVRTIAAMTDLLFSGTELKAPWQNYVKSWRPWLEALRR